MSRFTAEPFGGDCLGNPTGYRVCDNANGREVVDQYVGNIYREGSMEQAKQDAENSALDLNWDAEHFLDN